MATELDKITEKISEKEAEIRKIWEEIKQEKEKPK